VHPRVLEPLISLTLSTKTVDHNIAKKYIGQLVWLISYPNIRVQFQSAWGLANLALLDDDARLKIHSAGGTKTLFEWYTDMDHMVQLETLAAVANLTLSSEICEEMVDRHKCIPFFIDLVISNKLKHAQFACIALANLAYKESFREMIRSSGGIVALVGCIMSHDYQKRRHGCRALANMALSGSKEIEQVFESKGLLDKVIKMAIRAEIQTQQEVVALLRNLMCHNKLRALLVERGLSKALANSRSSVFENVVQWCQEIDAVLQQTDLLLQNHSNNIGGSSISNSGVVLQQMQPLRGQVEWSTWGSKLESIFEPIFAVLPSVANSKVTVCCNGSKSIYLPNGITKPALQQMRDSLSYNILEKPSHGQLSEYATTKDYVTYTPDKDYVGADFFVYRLQLGIISCNPASVAIAVEYLDDDMLESDLEANTDSKQSSPSNSPSNKKNTRNSNNQSKQKEATSNHNFNFNGSPSTHSPTDNTSERRPSVAAASPFMTNLLRRTTLRASVIKFPDQES